MASLADAANNKAKFLEAKVASIRSTHWKIVIGARTSEEDPRSARPTRAAYRYVRGNAAWQSSRIGNATLHDNIPTEPPDDDSDHEEERDSDNDDAELPIVYDDIVDFAPAQTAESNVPLSDQAAVDAEQLQ